MENAENTQKSTPKLEVILFNNSEIPQDLFKKVSETYNATTIITSAPKKFSTTTHSPVQKESLTTIYGLDQQVFSSSLINISENKYNAAIFELDHSDKSSVVTALSTAKTVSDLNSNLPIIFISDNCDNNTFYEMSKIETLKGFFPKDKSFDELAALINSAVDWQNKNYNMEKAKLILDLLQTSFGHDLADSYGPLTSNIKLISEFHKDFSKEEIVGHNENNKKYILELNESIQSLNKLARIAKNGLIIPEQINFSDIIKQRVDAIADIKKMRIIPDYTPNLVINSNPLFLLAVRNYVANAYKYGTKRDGTNTPVIIHTADEGDFVSCAVQDFGHTHISPEKSERLFDKDYRLEEHKNNTIGKGHGLYIAKLAVELVGGRAYHESSLGGNVFGFRIPKDYTSSYNPYPFFKDKK